MNGATANSVVKDTTFDGGYVGFGVFGNGRAIVRDLLVEEQP